MSAAPPRSHQLETIQIISKFIINDLKAILNKHKLSIEDNPLPPEAVWLMARAVQGGVITKREMRNCAQRWIDEQMYR